MNYNDLSLQQKAVESAGAQIGGLGAAVGQFQAQTTKTPQIQSAAERHGEALRRLQDKLDILCQRIAPILRPSVPTPTSLNEAKNPEAVQAPFASALYQAADHIDHLGFVIEDILNRIEL